MPDTDSRSVSSDRIADREIELAHVWGEKALSAGMHERIQLVFRCFPCDPPSFFLKGVVTILT
jgi:hypothetical protein